MAELGENRRRRFRPPTRQARISIRRVPQQCKIIRNRRGRDAEFLDHTSLVPYDAGPAIQLDHARPAHALCEVFVRRANDHAFDARIASRRQSLEDGTIRPEELLVPGAYAALRLLQERGLELYLASGTDENYVREEAELLGLTPFFGRHIYGAIADHRKFSKQMVIERILRENQVEGARLIGLGDGYVEIDNIKGAGGTAIAVASDEAGRSGKPDPWKRDRLIGVGADLVIPDFREFQAVCDYLWRDFR